MNHIKLKLFGVRFAIALSKIKDEKLRKELLQEATEQNLSVREIKIRVKELTSYEIRSAVFNASNNKKLTSQISSILRELGFECTPK